MERCTPISLHAYCITRIFQPQHPSVLPCVYEKKGGSGGLWFLPLAYRPFPCSFHFAAVRICYRPLLLRPQFVLTA